MKTLVGLLCFTLSAAAFAHPGGGVIALSENSAIVADSVENFVWRVFVKVVGLDINAQHHSSPTDSDLTLTDLTPGATIEVEISAVNEGGVEGPRSAAVQIVAP
jgi:hypothetical protein